MSTDLHTLTGAYAIDALTSEEAEQFRTHLDACPACQQEISELQAAAAAMGESEATAPPSGLKAKVMAAVDKQPQLSPRVPDLETARATRWTPRILGAAAAVVLIVAAGFGVSQIQQEPESTLAASVTRVFDAPDARTATVDTANGGKVSVATSQSLGEMAVDTDELPALSEEQVYQLWSIEGATPESVGVLDDPDSGASMAMPDEGTQVAITIEPSGGSDQPTTDPVVRVTPSEV